MVTTTATSYNRQKHNHHHRQKIQWSLSFIIFFITFVSLTSFATICLGSSDVHNHNNDNNNNNNNNDNDVKKSFHLLSFSIENNNVQITSDNSNNDSILVDDDDCGSYNSHDSRSRLSCRMIFERNRKRMERNEKRPHVVKSYTAKGYTQQTLPKTTIQTNLSSYWIDTLTNRLERIRRSPLDVLEDEDDGRRFVASFRDRQRRRRSPSSSSSTADALEDTISTMLRQWLMDSSSSALPPTTSDSTTSQSSNNLPSLRLIEEGSMVTVYQRGARLLPTVNRMPFRFGVMVLLHVEEEEEEGDDDDESSSKDDGLLWPLVFEKEDAGNGRRSSVNVTMNKPGDVIIYEGCSMVHGRPYPLTKPYIAILQLYFDFETTTTTTTTDQNHAATAAATTESPESDDYNMINAEELYNRAMQRLASLSKEEMITKTTTTKQQNTKQDEDELPSFISPGTEDERRWRLSFPKTEKEEMLLPPTTISKRLIAESLMANQAAGDNHLYLLSYISSLSPTLVHTSDQNGWTPFHEAIREGDIQTLVFFVSKQGALPPDMLNRRTNMGLGGSALYWAVSTHGLRHPVVKYLRSLGALYIAPEGLENDDNDDNDNDAYDDKDSSKNKTKRSKSNDPPFEIDRYPAHFYENATLAHLYADKGNLPALRRLGTSSPPSLLQSCDRNGWTPLHEAARNGHLHIIKYLLSFDNVKERINQRTGSSEDDEEERQTGGSAVWFAESYHGEESEIVKFLKEMGGESLAPLPEMGTADNKAAIENNDLSTDAHYAAYTNDLSALRSIPRENLFNPDVNGWLAFHEAARFGYLNIVRYLVENYVPKEEKEDESEGSSDDIYGSKKQRQQFDVNQRTNFGKGGTAMYYAMINWGDNHVVVEYLKSLGGVSLPPRDEKMIDEEDEQGYNADENEMSSMKEKEEDEEEEEEDNVMEEDGDDKQEEEEVEEEEEEWEQDMEDVIFVGI